MQIVFVAIGCAFGGVVRHLCMALVARCVGDAFPWGTLVVNILGSCLLGAILGAGIVQSEEIISASQLNAFWVVGFCGGLTTFSTFSFQNLALLSQQAWGRLALNIVGSVLLCLLAAYLSYFLVERWTA